jgi:hypothetical protein
MEPFESAAPKTPSPTRKGPSNSSGSSVTSSLMRRCEPASFFHSSIAVFSSSACRTRRSAKSTDWWISSTPERKSRSSSLGFGASAAPPSRR